MGYTSGNRSVTQVDGYTEQEANNRFLHRKNFFINGGFQIWQRGPSGTNADGPYTADMWRARDAGLSGGTYSWTKFVSPDSGNYLKLDLSGLTSVGYFMHKIEGGLIETSGKKVTISADFSFDVATYMKIEVKQNFGTGGTPSSDVIVPGSVAQYVEDNTDPNNSGWYRVSVTYDMPSIAGKTFGTNEDFHIEVLFILSSTSDGLTGAPADGAYRIRNAQFELGEIPTPIEYRPPGEELLLCQRYFFRFVDQYHYPDQPSAKDYYYPVTMRTVPNIINFTGPGSSTVNRKRDSWLTVTGLASDAGNVSFDADAGL